MFKVSTSALLCLRKTITALCFSPDGKYLVTGEVSLFSLTRTQCLGLTPKQKFRYDTIT